jgi:hypothetical protein
VRTGIFFTIAFCAALALSACRSSHPGPKLIEADGVTYTACGGAFWVKNEGDSRNPDSRSYMVIFKDAQGVDHQLPRVKILKVTALPSDTSACVTSR